jgi:predicted DNA-binding transcriptional regulator AlpA
MTRLLNKKQVAELIGLSVGGINKLIALRKIPYCKVTATKHGAVRFSPEVIEAWLQSNSTPATGAEVNSH